MKLLQLGPTRLRVGARLLTAAAALAILSISSLPAGAVSPPRLIMTSGTFHNYELISVAVGPNHFFKPYSRVNILECADPGGKKQDLPTNANTCDGNTIQGNTILVNKNGSFSEHGYEMYALPNKPQLGELPGNQPICNQKKSCVLYIGENQENFNSAKMFSPPFLIQSSGKKHT
jgi:hypothetical protein